MHRAASSLVSSSERPSSTSRKSFLRSPAGRCGIAWCGILFASSYCVSGTGPKSSRRQTNAGSGRFTSPVRRYPSIASAASRPWATASITAAGPLTASPPAKTPGRRHAIVAASASMVPGGPTAGRPSSGSRENRSGSVSWPTAEKAKAHGTSNSEPFTGRGLRRPLPSGSPSSMRTHRIPASRPVAASRIASTGATSIVRRTPSCSAASTSSWKAGISVRDRRYRIQTSSAPQRTAVRAASTAEFPPPTTTTFPCRCLGPCSSVSLRKSRADSIPRASSPGTPSFLPRGAPGARKMARNPSSRSPRSVNSLPSRRLQATSTPRPRITSMSASSSSRGRRYAGIPYRSIPPRRGIASKIVTEWPCRDR